MQAAPDMIPIPHRSTSQLKGRGADSRTLQHRYISARTKRTCRECVCGLSPQHRRSEITCHTCIIQLSGSQPLTVITARSQAVVIRRWRCSPCLSPFVCLGRKLPCGRIIGCNLHRCFLGKGTLLKTVYIFQINFLTCVRTLVGFLSPQPTSCTNFLTDTESLWSDGDSCARRADRYRDSHVQCVCAVAPPWPGGGVDVVTTWTGLWSSKPLSCRNRQLSGDKCSALVRVKLKDCVLVAVRWWPVGVGWLLCGLVHSVWSRHRDCDSYCVIWSLVPGAALWWVGVLPELRVNSSVQLL